MDDCVCYVTLRSGGTWFPVVRVGGRLQGNKGSGKNQKRKSGKRRNK